ncbi:DUF7620 family protein [Nocardioides terrigena]
MRWFRRKRDPAPSAEAVRQRDEIEAMKPRVESVMRERRQLLEENNYTARIRALYREGHA